MSQEKSTKWGIIYYATTVCVGIGASLAIKTMSTVTAPIPGANPEFRDYFQHPYMMSFFMFIGEYLCLPTFYLNRLIFKPKEDSKAPQKRINPLLCAIPALCDIVASSLVYIAYNLVAVSIIQMFTGVRIIVTAVCARAFLGNKLHRHHYAAFGFIVVGLLCVSYAVSTDTSSTTNPLGVIVLIIAYALMPIQMVIEEKLFRDYTLHPLEAIGYEGAAGIVYSIIMLLIFQQIPCTKSRQQGDYDTFPQTAMCPYGRLEESRVGMYQIMNSGTMFGLMLATIFTLCAFNSTSLGVTKHLSSTTRTTVSVVQTAILWAISIMIGWEGFLWMQLIGFLLATWGVVLYNEVYVPPIKNFDYNTKKNIAARKDDEGALGITAGKTDTDAN